MATTASMSIRASNAADRAAAAQAISDRMTAILQAPADEHGAVYMLDHYGESAMSLQDRGLLSKDGTPWQNGDMFAKGQMEWVIKRAKELGRKIHYAVIDTSSRPADAFKDPVGFRDDLSSNVTDEKEYTLRLRDHSSLIHQQLFAEKIGVMRPLTEAGLCEWSLHRVFTETGFSSSKWILESLKHVFAMDHGCDVLIVNMSLGSNSRYTAHYDRVFDTIQDKPVLVFASAGNAGVGSGDTVGVPARCKGVTAVGAYDKKRKWATFSSVGPDVDLIGPGHMTPTYDRDGKLVEWSGTSSSSPLVAALAGIIALVKPEVATQAKMRKILIEMADDLGDVGRDDSYGYGFVNLADYLAGIPAPPVKAPAAEAFPKKMKLTLRGVKIEAANSREARKFLRGQEAVVNLEGWADIDQTIQD